MAYKPNKKKLKELREQPNLFSILDNGDIATNNPTKESDKVNEKQDTLPYVVKTAYQQRYNKLVSLSAAIIQAKEGGNERQNSNANNNNPIKNTIETNTSIGNNIIQNNDNNSSKFKLG